MARPDDVSYTKTHEWVRIDGDVATVGITDHAVEQLSDLAYIDLPTVGDTFDRGQSFGEVESTKTVADLLAPVPGEVVEVNGTLVEEPQRLSASPFGEGWLIKLRAAAPPEGLLSRAEYDAFVASEHH